MKRILVSLLMLALLPTGSAFSQKGYAGLGFAYGFGAGTEQITSKRSATSVEGVYGSFGEGFRFGASGGYMFNKNIGAELGFLFLLGRSFDGDDLNNTKFKHSGSGFLFVPAFILSTGMEKIEPYAKLGLVLGFLKSTFEGSNAQEELNQTSSGGLGLGFLGGVGAAFHLSQMFSIYGEFIILTLTQNPSTLEVTKHTQNGQTAQDQGKKFDFKESYDPTNVAANTRLAVRNPFSSTGITVGARVRF